MKTFQSITNAMMMITMLIGLPMFFIVVNTDNFTPTDPDIVAQLDARIEKNQRSIYAQMTREPIGYFAQNYEWVPAALDRTAKP